jgi:catecholate siderophore receptor
MGQSSSRSHRRLRAQINVENIFGARYSPTADDYNNNTPGSPRAVRLTLTGDLS